ncbi:hypothetical protein AV530_015315 [Patagioenas fasciata monilis]|uniref:Uncharacterized protein n=1 Tax=Patagioenas fasciata monilis TaxID=372326 RepID=A0A1V4K1Q2_PATFA|nr:hypothetical protein AV530_015315 [Patagioenas fasciata monilis]
MAQETEKTATSGAWKVHLSMAHQCFRRLLRASKDKKPQCTVKHPWSMETPSSLGHWGAAAPTTHYVSAITELQEEKIRGD